MKKNTFVLGAIVLAVGFALCVVSYASVGFDLKKLGDQAEFEQKTFIAQAADVRALSILDENNTIEVVPSEDDEITITYYESPKDRYEVGIGQDGKLDMRYVNDRSWLERIGFQWGKRGTRVTVTMPAAFGGDMVIRTVNGALLAQGIQVGTLNAENVNGEIRLSGIAAAGESSIRTVNGQVSLTDMATASATVTATNGRIEVKNVDSKGALSLSTTNGTISGTLSGSAQDYEIDASTVNGANNLANSAGGGRLLSVHTVNGSIDIRFAS